MQLAYSELEALYGPSANVRIWVQIAPLPISSDPRP